MGLQKQLWTDMRIKRTEGEVQQYLDAFFGKYPGVHEYVERTKRFVEAFHFTWTFTGRRRRFPILAHSYAMRNRVGRQAVNARIQSTSADIIATNMLDVDREVLKPINGRMLLTVHDSLVYEVPEGGCDLKAKLDKVFIENTRNRFSWLPVPWKYDVGWGPNYGAAKYEVT